MMTLSLRDEAFAEILDEADDNFNEALINAISSGSSFNFTIKISMNNSRGRFAISGESKYKFDGASSKNKFELSDDVMISLDENGNPIIIDAQKQARLY